MDRLRARVNLDDEASRDAVSQLLAISTKSVNLLQFPSNLSVYPSIATLDSEQMRLMIVSNLKLDWTMNKETIREHLPRSFAILLLSVILFYVYDNFKRYSTNFNSSIPLIATISTLLYLSNIFYYSY